MSPYLVRLTNRVGPLMVVFMLFAGLVVLAPSKAPDRTNAFAGVGPGGTNLDEGSSATTGAPEAPGQAGAIGTQSTAPGASKTAGPGVTARADQSLREDCTRQRYFANASCKRGFAGDNGGATYRGVSASAIRIVFYRPKINPQAQAIFRAGGATASDEEGRRTIEVYARFFNKHVQTYNRKLDVVIYDGQAEPNDAAGMRAEAVKLDQEFKAYMVMGGANADMVDELARRGIVCICGSQLPGAFHRARAPFVFSVFADGDTTNAHIAEYICKRLGVTSRAEFAGDLIHPTIGGRDSVRRYGLMYPSTEPGSLNAADLERRLAGCGIRLANKSAYAPDINTAAQQATTAMQANIRAKVTTMLCACDPVAPIFATQAATAQEYFPEWFQTGYQLQDADFFGRLYDQQQWRRNFGISTLPVQGAPQDGDFWRAYKSEDPANDPPLGAQLIYPTMLVGFAGIELAGPRLNPATYRDGMYRIDIRPADRRGVAFSYSSTDFGGIDDAREVWWDPVAVGPDGRRGTYRSVNTGRRFSPGEWPATRPNVFNPQCDAAGSCGGPR